MPLPEDVQGHQLDREARKELLTLARDTAETVARHLVMAGRLVDEDPVAALAHARAARALAGRVAVAREANGLVAYAAGEWAEALTELRTARRISGDPCHLPVIADCERALGRPERALMVTEDPQASGLDAAARVELLIVASGARRDLGQAAAAVASLQVGALEGPVRPWTARLRYAYADALLDSGRENEAREWFGRTAELDPDGETDAVDRLLELDGVVLDEPERRAEGTEVEGTEVEGTEVEGTEVEGTDAARAAIGAAAEQLSAENRAASTAVPEPVEPRTVEAELQVLTVADVSDGEASSADEHARSDAPWQPTFSDSEGTRTAFGDPSTG